MFLKNNYETSERTGLKYPYAHENGGTLFIPVDIEETEIATTEIAEDGTETKSTAQGYKFREYRVNSVENLPQEIVQAILDAFLDDETALEALGLGGD